MEDNKSNTTLGVHYDKELNPIKMVALFEKGTRFERVEFKMVDNTWVQSDRKFSLNNG